MMPVSSPPISRVLSVAFLVVFLPIGLAANQPTESIGIVAKPAESGPCIPIDSGNGGYMVPYKQLLGQTGIEFEMIPVPGGTIMVGSPVTEAGHAQDEGPQYEVVLEPFWVGKTEVTWREYIAFMKTDAIFRKRDRTRVKQVNSKNEIDAVTIPTMLYAESQHREFGSDPEHPAVTMTQYSAKQYTKWLSLITQVQYRLPTEAEWEYAARAGSTSAYCNGDNISELDQYAVYSATENAQAGSAHVGSKKPNPFGLHDMHGNVWEWTIEQYTSDGYGFQAGRSFRGHAGTNWVKTLNSQCVRGGCWADPPARVRAAVRMGSDRDVWSQEDPEIPTSPWWYTSDPSRMVGMRIVRSLQPLDQASIHRFWENEIQELQDDINSSLHEGRSRQGLVSPELLDELQLSARGR